MRKLSVTAGLLHVLVVALVLLRDGFAERDARRTDLNRHLELILQTIHDNFQMQLAHACNDGLLGFVVIMLAHRGNIM